jgi:hypothetical protein
MACDAAVSFTRPPCLPLRRKSVDADFADGSLAKGLSALFLREKRTTTCSARRSRTKKIGAGIDPIPAPQFMPDLVEF